MIRFPIRAITSNLYVQDLKETVKSYHMKVLLLIEFHLMNSFKEEISRMQERMKSLTLIPYMKLVNLEMRAFTINIQMLVCWECAKEEINKTLMSVSFILH